MPRRCAGRPASVATKPTAFDRGTSNVNRAQAIRSLKETLRAQDGDALAAIQEPLLGVQESFLQAGFDQVQASYGTMTRYLTDGLGVSEAAIESLRSRLVV